MSGGGNRDRLGCICSIENIVTGQVITWHVEGLRGAAAREIARRIDLLGDDWRVVSYCTPATILTDMDGNRLLDDRRPGAFESPEAMVFSRLGRPDVVHPRLVGSVERDSRRQVRP